MINSETFGLITCDTELAIYGRGCGFAVRLSRKLLPFGVNSGAFPFAASSPNFAAEISVVIHRASDRTLATFASKRLIGFLVGEE